MIRLILFSLGILVSVPYSWSQNKLSFPVEHFGNSLSYPFMGGFNTPQFFMVDVNDDSIDEILVFDRLDGSWHAFQNHVPLLDEPVSLPDLTAGLPNVKEWVIFTDYNLDGVDDLFTFSSSGIQGIDVHKGIYVDGLLTFEKIDFSDQPLPVLSYFNQSNEQIQIFVTQIDYPVIRDINQDGDIDILTFDIGGSRLHLYENQAIETGGSPDKFHFLLADNCWGRVAEGGLDNTIFISGDYQICPDGFARGGTHTGSSITATDADMDGDIDIALGDIAFGNIVFLTNGGTPSESVMTSVNSSFPSPQNAIDIPNFPISFFLDINLDGLDDVIACPNEKNNIENQQIAWLYLQNESGQFEFQEKDFLLQETMDFGLKATPTLARINEDDLIDIVVSTREKGDDDFTLQSRLIYYQHNGTRDDPSFSLVDTNYLDLPSLLPNENHIAPVFGDLDGDSDYDLLIGLGNGELVAIDNVSSANHFLPGEATLAWQNIDVGSNATPSIIDLNADGNYDLVIGERNGNLNYFQNQGTSAQPSFDPNPENEPNNALLGGIDARQGLSVVGFSHPTWIESRDSLFLFVGTSFGNILVYEVQKTVFPPAFELKDFAFLSNMSAKETAPVLHDLDHDGKVEVLIGHGRGGLEIYQTPIESNPTTAIHQTELAFSVNNPFQSEMQISVPGRFVIEIYSLLGKQMFSQVNLVDQVRIPTSHWPVGTYVIQLRKDEKRWVRKVIKL